MNPGPRAQAQRRWWWPRRWIRQPALLIEPESDSALGFPLGGGKRPEYGQHRIQMGESGTEAVDKIAQREVAFEEIFVIILDVIGQLAHE